MSTTLSKALYPRKVHDLWHWHTTITSTINSVNGNTSIPCSNAQQARHRRTPNVHSNGHVNNLVRELQAVRNSMAFNTKTMGICLCATTTLTKNSNCSTSKRPTATHTIQEPTLGLLGAALDRCNNDRRIALYNGATRNGDPWPAPDFPVRCES